MDYKTKRRVLNVEADGVNHPVRFPKVSEVEAYEAKLKLGKSEDAFGLMKTYLAELGLPTTVTNSLEMEDLLEISKILGGQKKS